MDHQAQTPGNNVNVPPYFGTPGTAPQAVPNAQAQAPNYAIPPPVAPQGVQNNSYQQQAFAPQGVQNNSYQQQAFAPQGVQNNSYQQQAFAPQGVQNAGYPQQAFAPQGVQNNSYQQQAFAPQGGAPNNNVIPPAGYSGGPGAMPPPSGMQPTNSSPGQQVPAGGVPNQAPAGGSSGISVSLIFFGLSGVFFLWSLIRFLVFCCNSEIREKCRALDESVVIRFFTVAFDSSNSVSFNTFMRNLFPGEYWIPRVTLYLFGIAFVLFIVGALILERRKKNGTKSFAISFKKTPPPGETNGSR